MTRSATLPVPATTAASPYWTWALLITVVITLARMLAMRISPLELYPDEAQYWLWSQSFAPGYFTKPPLIAWLIRLSTLGGDTEPFVRLSSPLLHAATGLLLYGVGGRLYRPLVGFFALLVYQLTPAVQIGAFIVSTDTALVTCLSGALLAYVALQSATGRARLAAAAWLGFALGLALLAKYAALYAIAGIGLHLSLSREARRVWGLAPALLAVGIFVAMAAPNVAWNLSNGFVAVGHVASEAAWGGRSGGPLAALTFLASQLVVFAPAPFLVLIFGGGWLAWRRKLEAADSLLLAWTLPALVIVLGQALIAGAKANWAVAAYAPGSVLVAAWMLRWGRPRLLIAVVAAQALILVLVLAGEVMPQLADRAGLSAALKGVRGGRTLTSEIVSRAQTEMITGDQLTAVAIDDRELYNLAAYYGRGFFGHEGPPLLAWRAGGPPRNEEDLVSPLTPAAGAHVLMVSRDGVNTAAMTPEFQHAGAVAIGEVWTDPKHKIAIDMFVGDGFAPKR